LKMLQISRELAEQHYGVHRERPFFASLVEYITSAPVVVGVLEGPKAIDVTRATVGSTNPVEAAPGTIRGDRGLTIGRNLIHAAGGEQTAEKEIALFFGPEELISYQRAVDPWIVEE